MEIEISELKTKKPLNIFCDDSLKKLSALGTTTRHNKKEKLFSVGDKDDTAVFLMKGSIILESIDGRVIFVNQYHDMSKLALTRLKPRMHKAVAATDDTILFWIKDELLNKSICKDLQ